MPSACSRDRPPKPAHSRAKPALLAATTLLRNLDQSYSDPGGLREGLTAGIADFDKLGRSLNDTSHQLQQALQDARPGVRTFSQRTLADVGELVAEARQQDDRHVLRAGPDQARDADPLLVGAHRSSSPGAAGYRRF